MINSDNKLVFQATGDPAEISSGNASSLITSDAASFQKQGAEFFTLKYYSALSANWWLEAQVGYYKSVLDAYPLDEDFMTQANYLEDDGILTENYWDAQYSDRFRNQANVLMTYFKRGWAGSHQFKFGVDVQDVKLKFNKFSPGGGYYYSWISANHLGWWPDPSDPKYYPYFHYVDVPAGELENKGTLLAGFVQDEWTISPKLTANIGFRFDSAKYDNDIGREVMDLSLIQPRFGLAFDARGNGTSLWKCSYSTYMDPSLLALPMFLNAHANATDVYLVDEGWGIDWNGDSTLNEAYYTTFGGPGGTIVDPEGLNPTFATEYQVGYEQRLTPNQGIKVTWVYRETDDIIEDVYWGRDGIDNDMDGTIDGIDTDFDGTIDIDDDEEQVYVIKNLENGRRRYYGVELRYNAKIPRGEIIASYTWGKAKGNIGYTQSVGSAFDYPALSVNRYGYMYYDRRHTVKINGYINLPLDFQVGWDAICHTGEPYDTLASAVDYGAPYGSYFVEQRGSRRLPNFYQLNVEGRKTFKIGKTMVQLILSIYNLLDDEIVTSVNELYTSTNFGMPLTYQQPRRFEVGLKYQF